MADNIRPAGEGLSDEELVKEVAEQTSPDLKAKDVFEREQDGAATDDAAAEATGSELSD